MKNNLEKDREEMRKFLNGNENLDTNYVEMRKEKLLKFKKEIEYLKK